MRDTIGLVREIAPGMDAVDNEILALELARLEGAVLISTETGIALGATCYKGAVIAEVVVECDRVSRQSGGELYRLKEVHTDDADHYVISGPADFVIERIPLSA